MSTQKRRVSYFYDCMWEIARSRSSSWFCLASHAGARIRANRWPRFLLVCISASIAGALSLHVCARASRTSTQTSKPTLFDQSALRAFCRTPHAAPLPFRAVPSHATSCARGMGRDSASPPDFALGLCTLWHKEAPMLGRGEHTFVCFNAEHRAPSCVPHAFSPASKVFTSGS